MQDIVIRSLEIIGEATTHISDDIKEQFSDIKFRQEKKSLVNISDSFKKIIVVRDSMKMKRDEDGIITMSLFDFLLDENSLEK